MAIGTITVTYRSTEAPFLDLISFAGDGAYASGGTAAFEDSVQAALSGGSARKILAVVGQDCGGYVPVYDYANDKLKVYEQTDTATTPLIETATADLSGTTFKMLVISK